MSQTASQPVDPNRTLQVSLTLAQWNTHLTLLSLLPALVDGQLRQLQTQLTAQLQFAAQAPRGQTAENGVEAEQTV